MIASAGFKRSRSMDCPIGAVYRRRCPAGQRGDRIRGEGRAVLLARQFGRSHQKRVHRTRALPALADRPDDERLAAAHVARREDLRDRRRVGLRASVSRRHCRARPSSRRTPRAATVPARRIPSPAAPDRRESRIPSPGFPASCRPSMQAHRLQLLDLALSPTSALVAMDQSRSTPSSCEDDVRSRVGQYGQTGLRSTSGGIGSSSKWVTEAAPWRFEVPTQSEPVSPPPMTTTCLPFAHRSATPRRPRRACSAAAGIPSRNGRRRGRARESAGRAALRRRPKARPHRNRPATLRRQHVFASFGTPLPGGALPTQTPPRNSTPSARICSRRRSITRFSSLKSGIP